jgi:hypothetical protein
MGQPGRRAALLDRWSGIYIVVCYAVAVFLTVTAVRWSLARSWPAVPAVILSSWVEEVKCAPGIGPTWDHRYDMATGTA